MKNNHWKIWMHLLGGASFFHLLRLLLKYGFDLRPIYLVRVLYVVATSFLLSPFRVLEYLFYTKSINAQKIQHAPVFIIGHWRSGTTYLYNLLSRDKKFGFITTFQAFIPGAFFIGTPFLKFASGLAMPGKRPMDDVKVSPDEPQEEEFAIANRSVMSFYHCLFYPDHYPEFSDKYVFFKTIPDRERKKWMKEYLFIIKKITLANKGKQLLLKNPVNTARIPLLLKMFPDSKFIYLHRNAEETISSTKKMYMKFCEINSFEKVDKKRAEKNMEAMFYELQNKYERDKQLIPSKNLAEVDYTDLVIETQKTLGHIYHRLQLDGFLENKTNFENYIVRQKEFKRDVYPSVKNL